MAALKPIKPLYSASATATQGSKIINVTGGVDCSFLKPGSIIALGTRQLVDAVSGTAPDVNGDSTITLSRNWTDPTTTGALLSFMSWEGLADAVVTLRNMADASESALQGAFSFMGSWDATAGDLPPAPADNTGSQIYRIGVAGTMAGRAYRVGEEIYYDQYTNEWRSTVEFATAFSTGLLQSDDAAAWLTALGLTKTASSTDSTAGRITKVGDGGILGIGVSALIADLDDVAFRNGIYGVTSSALNKPAATAGSAGMLIQQVYTTASGVQVTQLFSTVSAAPRIYHRTRISSTWSAWAALWDETNLVKTTSAIDFTAGRMLKVGDAGIFTPIDISAAGSNANNINYSARFVTGSSWTGSPFAGTNGNNQGYLDSFTSGNPLYAVQFFTSLNATKYSAYRRLNNGVWEPWVFNWHGENLVKTTSATDTTAGSMLQVGDGGLLANELASVTFATLVSQQFTQIRAAREPAILDGDRLVIALRGRTNTNVPIGMDIACRGSGNEISVRSILNGTPKDFVDIYSQENALGTVSQSGGIPTGAIIERGSNPNGEYTKFADGTLFLWKRDAVLTRLSPNRIGVTWNLPTAASIGTAIMGYSISGISADATDISVLNLTAPYRSVAGTTSTTALWQTSVDVTTMELRNVYLFAISRWYN